MTGRLENVAARVVRVRAWRFEVWTLTRFDGDPATDLWFWVGNTRTRWGAWRRLRWFLAACADRDYPPALR